MTLPQKLKRLAAFDYDQAKMYAAIVKGCDAGNGNDGMSSDAELYAFGMEEQNRRMKPLIEALIACAEVASKVQTGEKRLADLYDALTALEKLSGDI